VSHWHYLMVMAGCVLVTLPLELVLGARVWRRPRALLAALAPVVLVFVVWDLWGIYRGSWFYADEFITGLHLGPMPIEELVFFVVVPICGVLTYEAVGRCLTWLRGGPPPWSRDQGTAAPPPGRGASRA
jgi:lycopene cyclase domain-containing protein